MKEKIKQYYKEKGLVKTIKWIIERTNSKIKRRKLLKKSIKSKDGNNPEKLKNSKNKRLFMFASVPYFDVGGGQRSAQISNIFYDKKYDVIYIYGFPTGESEIHKIKYKTHIHKYIKNFKIKEFSNLLRKDDLVFFEMPTKDFLPYLNIAYEKEANIIYENIDNWESSMGKKFFDKNILKEFMIKSNLLTATSKKLKEQLIKYTKEFNIKNKKIIYSANAVNETIFNPEKKYNKPKDMIIGTKTFLYYGSLWVECFDWDLIKGIANYNKDYSINIIGDKKNVPHIIETMPKNVYFLGLKKQTELPSYLKYSDYALFPFKNDDIGKYVSPLKIFEYISMNTKVLATNLPDIENYPNTFYADTFNEWKKEIEKNTKIDIEKNRKFIQKNNWKYRVDEIINNLK